MLKRIKIFSLVSFEFAGHGLIDAYAAVLKIKNEVE